MAFSPDSQNMKGSGKPRSAGERTRSAVLVALFAAILAVTAWVTVPSTVPFTMQTFGVFAALYLLGGKRGTAAIALYLAIGAVGVPVFSGFRGGFSALFGTTGGYLLGFLLTGLLYRLLTGVFGEKRIVKALASAAGLLVCYAFGTAWFAVVYARTGGTVSLTATVLSCVVPFVLPDIAKILLAAGLSTAVNKRLQGAFSSDGRSGSR